LTLNISKLAADTAIVAMEAVPNQLSNGTTFDELE